jgi:hypothetical protein
MKRISVNIDNATTLTWEEEHRSRYLRPSDIVKITIPCKKKEKEE